MSTQLSLFDVPKSGKRKKLTDDEKYHRKVEFAIQLLRSIPQDCEIELSYSGGKDSDVILELAKMAGIPFRAIYKNTTIDPPGTIRHCREKGVEILAPKKTFFELIREKGMPSRFYRFCCEVLKEYKVCDRAIQGIRRAESTKRAEKYKEPEICRVYLHKEKARVYLPILEWTDNDVERFIAERGIQCHPLYYDENGNLHVERRLGCIGCPLASVNNLQNQFLIYPKMMRLWIKNAQIYLDTHTHTKTYDMFGGSAYNWMFGRLFATAGKEKYKHIITGGMFHETAIDTKKFLEDYFKIDLTI